MAPKAVLAVLSLLLLLAGCVQEECFSADHEQKYAQYLTELSGKEDFSYVIFTEKTSGEQHFVQFMKVNGTFMDIPMSQVGNRTSEFLRLMDSLGVSVYVQNFTSTNGTVTHSYQADFNDSAAAARVTHQIFRQFFGLPSDYQVCVKTGR